MCPKTQDVERVRFSYFWPIIGIGVAVLCFFSAISLLIYYKVSLRRSRMFVDVVVNDSGADHESLPISTPMPKLRVVTLHQVDHPDGDKDMYYSSPTD